MVAIARHMGVELHWMTGSASAPTFRCWWMCSPPGEFLGEKFHRAGGVPAVLKELLAAGRLHDDAMTVTGKTLARKPA